MQFWRLGSIDICPQTRRLLQSGQPVAVGSRAFDLLLFLLQQRERVVSKAELLRAVWPGMVVEDNNLTVQISTLRKVLGAQSIRTVAGRGYRFVGELQRLGEPESQAPEVRHDGPGRPPIPTTRFFGREREMASIGQLLRQSRLLTLCGLAGAGKTRLAIEIAHQMHDQFAEGVWFLELAALQDGDALEPALAAALQTTQKVGKTLLQSLREAVGQRQLLLILDNCEHVLEKVATLLRSLLSTCAGLQVLATSREALMLEGEQTWPVRPLGVDAGLASPAVQLFIDRAHGVAPHLAWEDQADVLVDICQQLDGLPLAIELAAVRMRSMTAMQIRDHLHARYHLLTVGVRGGIERHQTLEKAVQWSFELLSEAERAVLMGVCVFAGGFTLQAAQQVCGLQAHAPRAVLDVLDALVRKSLLTTDHTGLHVRYGMLETIRQFSHAQLLALDKLEQSQSAHADYFGTQARRYYGVWRSADEPLAYAWLDVEASNIQAAYHWLRVQARADAAIALVAHIYEMARSRAHGFASGWISEILEEARARKHRQLPVVLCWASNSAWASLRFDAVQTNALDSLALLGQPGFEPLAWSSIQLAYLHFYQGQTDQALEYAKAAAQHPSDAQDRYCLGNYVALAGMSGRSEAAYALAQNALDTLDPQAMPCARALVYMGRGAALEKTDPAACIADIEHGAKIARLAGNRLIESFIVLWLAATQARSGTPLLALQAFSRTLQTYAQGHNLGLNAAWKSALIVVLERLGHREAAAVIHGGIVSDPTAAMLIPDLQGAVVRLRKNLGTEDFKLAQTRGLQMQSTQAAEFAQMHIQQAIDQLRLEGSASSSAPPQ